MSVPKHIVAVAGMVTDPCGRILMLQSARGYWEFPGGQVEEGESLTGALVREVSEETGIDVEVGALVGVYSNLQRHIVMLDFICNYVSGQPTTSSESPIVEWVDRAAVLSRITRPNIQDRMRDMMEFDGRVVFRSYTFDAAETTPMYKVHDERLI